MAPKLAQVYLMVSDLETSEQFYQEAIGLSTAKRGDRSVEFETGAVQLKLEADFDEETLENFGLTPPGDHRGEGGVIVLEVGSVEEVYDRVTTADVGEVLTPPREVSWGRKLLLVSDPDGYVLEISRPLESTE